MRLTVLIQSRQIYIKIKRKKFNEFIDGIKTRFKKKKKDKTNDNKFCVKTEKQPLIFPSSTHHHVILPNHTTTFFFFSEVFQHNDKVWYTGEKKNTTAKFNAENVTKREKKKFKRQQ